MTVRRETQTNLLEACAEYFVAAARGETLAVPLTTDILRRMV
jgi:hypothetical protein